jgi:hypothetical protein
MPPNQALAREMFLDQVSLEGTKTESAEGAI